MGRGDAFQIQGQQGGVVLAAGGSTVLPMRFVTVASDAVLAGLTSNLQNSSSLVGITLPAGFSFGAEITALSVTSGVVITYHK